MVETQRIGRAAAGWPRAMVLVAGVALVLGCGRSNPPSELKIEVEGAPAAAEPAPVAPPAGPGDAAWTDTAAPAEAVRAAAAGNRYVALVLHKAGDTDRRGLLAAVRARAEASGGADCVVARTDDPDLAALFGALKLDTGTMPTPAALMLAANGIVTGVFTAPPTAERFQEALLPAQPLAVLSALREGKKVIVTAQSPATTGNAETDRGIESYLASITNRASFALVKISLEEAGNAPFLRQLKINPQSEKQAVTLVMAPPMTIATTPIRGAVTKELLSKAMDACSSGACGPGG